MSEASLSPRRVVRPAAFGGYSGDRRRFISTGLLGFVSTVALLMAPALASADSSSTLTVVGTSDMSDSGLIPNLIQPGFQKANPQFTFKYIGTATGTAISDAESGSVGASVLIVHAASLENQFVANGFSQEHYGRALFTNDFVLAGSTGDPAGVSANGSHDNAQAFADIATAGINGGGTPRATLVSRGGTPGTTVAEHQIWQLVSALPSPPAGLLLCAVNSTLGGGLTPIAAGNGVTASGQPCPGGGALPTGTALPAWYQATGLTQGPNVVAANACNGYPSGPNSCYALTDRGTFDYLASGTDPAGSIPGLAIVTRQNSASAPGGANALINYFHAYIINPSKPGQTVNLPAAQAFVNFITSPAVQGQLKGYLANTSDPGGPPFVADASPIITASGFRRVYHAGKPLTVTGTITNAQPGYPPPAGKPVAVEEILGSLALPVAQATTNSTGAYRIRFTPPATGSYEVTTPQIAQIEIPTLNPPFGDLLSPGATAPFAVTVHSAIANLRARAVGDQALIVGSVAPGTGHVKASIKVLARLAGSKRGFKTVATARLATNDGNFAIAVTRPAGRWQFKLKFKDPKQVRSTTSHTVSVTVGPAPATSVSFGPLSVKRGSLKLTANLRAAAAGAKLELLALNTTSGKPARFRTVAKATVRASKVKLRAHLKRASRYVLALEYVQNGRVLSLSRLKSTNVK